MKKILFLLPVFLTSCFFKFSGTDILYQEGKKQTPSLLINRIWCSQCGCDAIEIKQMEKSNVVYEMLLNCTANCPPGVESYKIEREYNGNTLIKTKYFLLVKDEVGAMPLTQRDTTMIAKLHQFKSQYFFQHECLQILNDYKGCIETNETKIVKP